MVQGFTINKDGTRKPCDYGSDRERAWCECYELHGAGLYEEAYHKLDEYHAANGGRINNSDWPFILKIEIGYLKVKPTEQNFINTKYAWRNAVFPADDHDAMANLAEDIVDIFIKVNNIPVEYDDFSKATPVQTVKSLEFMLSVFRMGNDHHVDFESTDFLHRFSMGIRELRSKGENKKTLELFDEVKKLSYYGNYFIKRDNPFKDDDEEDEE